MAKYLLITNIIVFHIGILLLISEDRIKQESKPPITIIESIEPEQIPINYELADPVPDHLSHAETTKQLNQWAIGAKKIATVGTYGKSSLGEDLHYIRISSDEKKKPVVLITACIHGNEPLSAATAMAYIGTIIDSYNDDPQVTELVNTREIYFIPIISPDSYPETRFVDGVDPNRNFPTAKNPTLTSIVPVQALRDFFLKIQPDAVMSLHTFGRIIIKPWGDQHNKAPHDKEYDRIVKEICDLTNYRLVKGSNVYRSPMIGTEMDWYYRKGAASSIQNGKKIHRGAFSIVCELGTHQRIPSKQDIETEFNRTFQAFLYFCQEAPLVEIYWDEKGNPVNADGTPKIASTKKAA